MLKKCLNYNWVIFILSLIGLIIIHQGGYNQSLFLTINHAHNLLPDQFWEFFNFIAYSRYFILASLLLLLVLWRRREYLVNVLLLIISYYLIFAGLKLACAEARPYVVLAADQFYWLNHFENATKSAYQSFPSGHAGNMAIFAFALSRLFFKDKLGLQFLMVLMVIFSALARICTGWHWPVDVIASGLIAYLLVQLAFAINFKRK
ncbi:MAG: hypothetical protein RLZZ293_1155 [Pseudomonadota bacterium]|jgi:membrane-associated phospholipid phosphatase